MRVRLPGRLPDSLIGLRAAALLGAAAIMLTGFGIYAWLFQNPGPADPTQFPALVALPAAIIVGFLWSATVDRRGFFVVVALLDVETVLLGAQLGAPYFVVVPIIGIALATSLLPPRRLFLPYIAGWAAAVGATLTFLLTSPVAAENWTDVPVFAVIDAAVLVLLWQNNDRRSRALHAVEEAEQRFRALLEGVELFAVAQDRDDRITFINSYALRKLGRTLDETLGRDWHDTYATPERRAERRAHYRDVMAGRATQEPTRESEIVGAMGERLVIRWSHATLHDASGRISGLASIGEDVTAVRAAAEAARQASELMGALVTSSPLPSIILGLDRTVQFWNPAAVALLGWTEGEVLGRRLPDMLTGRDRRSAARCLVRAIRGEGTQGEQIAVRRKDGTVAIGRLYAGPLRDAAGMTVALAAQLVDVTAQQAMEEQLREAQKMEAVGRLAGGVAHDFNNSLTAIGGFAALISASTDDPQIREDAETITAAVQRAGHLTRELLAYSRRSLLQPETIDLNSLVAAVRPMLRRLLGEDIQIVIESDAPDAFVRVDPGQLERALLNLAANARDAMPDGGRLTIATSLRSGGPEAGEAGWVVIAVTDTGVGIAPEHKAQVFDPFFTTKPVGAGTGLGLAMVQGFVLQSGGRIQLASEPGAGTTVEILLPRAEGRARAVAPLAEPAESAGRGETVLYVEDEAAVAAAGFQLLRRQGYRVLLADNGAAAIALLQAHPEPIALLLLDVILPDMRGPQVAEAAVSTHPEAAVLYASGYSADTFARTGGLDPAVELIEKPYTAEQLAARVRSVIDRHFRDRERAPSSPGAAAPDPPPGEAPRGAGVGGAARGSAASGGRASPGASRGGPSHDIGSGDAGAGYRHAASS